MASVQSDRDNLSEEAFEGGTQAYTISMLTSEYKDIRSTSESEDTDVGMDALQSRESVFACVFRQEILYHSGEPPFSCSSLVVFSRPRYAT